MEYNKRITEIMEGEETVQKNQQGKGKRNTGTVTTRKKTHQWPTGSQY